jgi:hypothetical protein
MQELVCEENGKLIGYMSIRPKFHGVDQQCIFYTGVVRLPALLTTGKSLEMLAAERYELALTEVWELHRLA